MKQPNEVPEGATHWCEGGKYSQPGWYKLDTNGWWFQHPDGKHWLESETPWVRDIQRIMLSDHNADAGKMVDHSVDATDMVNSPPHYQLRDGYEVYDLRQDLAAKAQALQLPHDLYSDWDRAIEYLLRCWEKNQLEDIKKARWYLDKMIEKLEPEE
jgi:hypothetical protein